jgi:hypothetical protein
MEAMLPLDEAPYDPRGPVSGFDERPGQLSGAILAPLPLKPGRSKRHEDAAKRHGTGGVLLAFDPWSSWRCVPVSARRTAVDEALLMKPRGKKSAPSIKRLRLVHDNLPTQTPGSFDSAVPPQEAGELAHKFELHDTPVKGRWLHMAERAFAALSQPGLARRMGDIDTLAKEIAAWNDTRKRVRKTGRWKCTQTDARRKLHHKYPVGQD